MTAQVHMVYENARATKIKLEEIKEETAKDPGLKKVTKCIIELLTIFNLSLKSLSYLNGQMSRSLTL